MGDKAAKPVFCTSTFIGSVLGPLIYRGYWTPLNIIWESTSTLIRHSGLKCDFPKGSNEGTCTSVLDKKTIKVKHNDHIKQKEIISLSRNKSAKIKIQKNVTNGGYNKNLKLTIVGGDIDLNTELSELIKIYIKLGNIEEYIRLQKQVIIPKLEEFETYEIAKEWGIFYYLSRKSTAIEGKSKALGLPEGCQLPEYDNSSTTCELNEDKLKKINFEGKGEIIDVDETAKISLEITKTTDTTTYPHWGYKFIFKTNKDITISPSISLNKNFNNEFKIRKEEHNLTLERV